jgi:NAD+ synthase (glutamine-hydrolysing)
MKIALAQLNYHIGNFDENTQKILNAIEKAKLAGAGLVVFSEMAVCGYPPQDFLEQRDFVASCQNSINKIAEASKDIAVIVGGVKVNDNPKGKRLFNCAFFISNGKIVAEQKKTLLPTYDIFDEYRYFEPNTDFNIIEHNGLRIALTVCEDLWDDQPVENSFAKSRLYVVYPMKQLIEQKPDLIINIAASPFSYTQDHVRKEVLVKNTQRYNLPIVYVNQVGANTEIIFDGGSLVLNRKGETMAQLAFFKEDFQIIDLSEIEEIEPLQQNEYQGVDASISKIHDALVLGIKDYFRKSGLKKATLGLSGGIDSAVTLVLAEKALGKENIRVLLLPSKYSSEHSITDAVALAKNLDIQYDIIPIQDAVNAFEQSLNPLFRDLKFDITEENIQARARGVILMALSNKFGHILLNTSNKSEAAVGYGTLYGDMNGGLSVIGDVYKTDVFRLARYINRNGDIIPENTIIKPPSAELRPNQKDSDSLPEYDMLDKILYQYLELKKSASDIIAEGFDPAIVNKTISMVIRNEFKRFQAPPILRVSNKAFGMGRRMPIVAKYEL